MASCRVVSCCINMKKLIIILTCLVTLFLFKLKNKHLHSKYRFLICLSIIFSDRAIKFHSKMRKQCKNSMPSLSINNSHNFSYTLKLLFLLP